ncbi:MAG: YebC/PmpR family DNA-binding transcriptional regulator [Firmicutes bacterium]|nr:YebC/PmpR family DNA-binding transcriptional regulator [Bacillota bacterium]
MSGHSKWHNIKVRKSKVDAVKGKLFTRVSREILMAVKQGGSDPENNFRLKMAVQKAREVNMPMDNIKRVIEKASGEGGASNLEEIIYEGYAPGGVAVIAEAATDNRNRTAADIRNIFARYGGNMGENGCVAWIFKKKGLITINSSLMKEDELMDIALEAGAEDLKLSEETFELTTEVAAFSKVKQVLDDKGIKYEEAEITMIPSTVITVDKKDASGVLKLMEALEDNEDVQHVYANFDIPASIMEEIAAEV